MTLDPNCQHTIQYATRYYFQVRSKADMSQLYRTETTTKNCKTKKTLKSKNGYARSNSNSLGNHVVSPEEEKERLQWEVFAEKEGINSRMKERAGDGKLIITSIINHNIFRLLFDKMASVYF